MTDSEKLKEIQKIVAATIMTINMLPFRKEEAMTQGFKEVAKACKWHLEGKSYGKELEKEMKNL